MPIRQRPRFFRSCLVGVIAASPLLGMIASQAATGTSPQYTVTDLGPIGYVGEEYNFSQAQMFRVNDNEFVVGTSAVGAVSRAVVREPGAAAFVFLPFAVVSDGASAANAINAGNAIAGWSHVNHEPRATIWQRDNTGAWLAQVLAIPAGYTKSTAWDINDNGLIVGSVQDESGKYPVYWLAANQDPIFVGGGNAFVGEAFAVNNLGRVVGVKGTNVWGATSQSFYWDIGSPTHEIVPNITGPLGTGKSSWGAFDVNEQNLIVGGSDGKIASGYGSVWDQTMPYAWSASKGTQLIGQVTSMNAWAVAVNDVGYVVGQRQQVLSNTPPDDPKNRAPLVYRQEADANGVVGWKEYFLSSQIPPADQAAWWFYSATGISNVGRIVGMGSVAGGERRAYMLTPAVSDLSISQTVVTPAPAAKPGATTRSKVSSRAVDSGQSNTQIKLRVLNQGPLVATNVVVESQLAADLELVESISADGACTSSQSAGGSVTVRCAFASLPVGSTGSATLAVSAASVGEFDVVSTASATELDTLNVGNNRVSQKVAVTVAKTIVTDPVVGAGLGSTGRTDSTDPAPSGGASDFSLPLLALAAAFGRGVARRKPKGSKPKEPGSIDPLV